MQILDSFDLKKPLRASRLFPVSEKLSLCFFRIKIKLSLQIFLKDEIMYS